MRRVILPALLALALVLALVAAFLLYGARTGAPVGEETAREEATAPGPDTVRLEGAPGGRSGSEAPRDVEPPTPSEGPAADDGSGPKGLVFLRGTLRVAGEAEDFPFSPPLPMHVTLCADPLTGQAEPFVVVSLEACGTFEIDVTELLTTIRNEATEFYLHVSCHREGLLPVRAEVPVPDLEGLMQGRVRLQPLDLELHAAGLLRGRILTREGDGAAWEKPGWIHVLLYRFADGVPEEQPVSEATPDKTGRFLLPFGRDGRYVVAATHVLYGRSVEEILGRTAPVCATLDLHLEESPREVVLRLGPSYDVKGRVRWGTIPVANADVEWRLVEGGTALDSSRHWASLWDRLAWVDGEVVWAGGEIRTALDGTFRLFGLSRRPYRLRVVAWRGALFHERDAGRRVQVVEPPASDVRIDLPLARVAVRVTSHGTPVEGRHLRLGAVGMDPSLPDGVLWDSTLLITDEDGRAEHDVSPGCRFFLGVEGKEVEHVHRTFTSPAAGQTHEIELDVVAARPKPSLVVTFEGEGADLERAGFALTEPEEDLHGCSPALLWADEKVSAEGVFVLKDAVHGPWRLHVRAGRAWHDPPGAWVEGVHTIVVPASGTMHLTVRVTRGGRLLLDVHDVEGRYPEAACVLLDPDGEEVPAWFRYERVPGTVVLSTHHLPGESPCWVEPVLAAGVYTVRLAAKGYRTEERRVILKAGQPSIVRVVLEPE